MEKTKFWVTGMRVLIPANYSEERRYIIDVMLGEFLGVEYGVEIHDQRDYRLLLKNGKSLVIERIIFFLPPRTI